ncbi:MAG: hypothetical protein CXR30_14470 [Geobacter sp.]|nr:MAG: hypothetical protein CXR30_14470 [Geobacter sp.]
MKLCRNTLIRILIALVIISSLLVSTGFCQETEDSQIFIAGFNSYQQKDYPAAIDKMNEVLQKYPDTPLRDMALFWLSRAYFKSGNQQEAARYMSQFSKEYPDNPLKNTVEEELLNLVARYDKGEKLPTGTAPGQSADKLAAAKKAKAEKDRLVKEAAEKERLAREDAEKAALAQQQAEQERVAKVKAEQERIAAEKAEQERLVQEKAAKEKAEQERIAAEKAEQQRLALLKVEEDRKASELAEQQRLAANKAAEELKQASKKIEQERAIAEKAEQERIAAEKTEQQRLALLKAEEDNKASELAEQQRLAALAEEERKQVAEKAKQDRIVAAQAEQRRLAQEKAAQQKAEEERIASEKAEQQRLAVVQEEERQLARKRAAEEQGQAEKKVLREKAITQYKSIIENYPGSKAAAVAAAKLQELGIAVALPAAKAIVAEQKPAEQPENAQVLRLEVAQFAGFEFHLLASPKTFEVARRISLPFEITNRGNGKDSFYLESGFPAEFNANFAATDAPEQNINQTPALAPGETFKGVVNLTIPASSIDGLRITHPVKAASRFMSEATQSREVNIVAAAPLLRAVVKTDKTQPLPGDKVTYRIAVLNVGSTAAKNVSLRLNFPPQLEPVDYAAAGFKQEMKAALVYDGLQVNSGENKEFTVTFQLKDDSLANQELLCRAELINNQLNTNAAFVSNAAYVQTQHGITVRPVSDKLVIIPGQTITVPFVVTNTGNVREKFKIVSAINGAQDAVVFHDLNRDGIRQPNEPVINEIGPLESKEEAGIALEMKTPRSATDSSEGNVQVSFISEGDAARTATASALLVYSRPVLQMAMSSRDGRLKPGEVASFDLTITNFGTNLARVVELHSAWPEQLELVAADPADSSVADGNILWKFKELGAGEKRTIKVSFRVKPGTGVGTNIQVKNVLKYEDQLGNRY